MREIVNELVSYHRKYFHLSLYLSIGAILISILTFNYLLDFEDNYIDRLPLLWRTIGLFLYQAIPYLLVCVLLYIFNIQRTWLNNKGFWLRFFVGFSLLASSRSYTHYPWLSQYFSGIDLTFFYHVMFNLRKFILLMIPLAVFYWLVDSHKTAKLYGLIFNKFSPKPYFQILGVALVCIIIGSFFKDIQRYYPLFFRYGGPAFALHNHWPEWAAVILYEIPYALDFINVEFFFRGFLIVAFTRYLGPQAVLPMVVAYCALHFGKPLTEAISSIFGGYILGIISFHSKTIWGGVIIHAGTAWCMELVGFFWRFF